MTRFWDYLFGAGHPRVVQIDTSLGCNINCITCFSRSPLITERKKSNRNTFLPTDRVLQVLNSVGGNDDTVISFAGEGEPFTHPEIMRILRIAKEGNRIVQITTNGTFLDEEKTDYLLDIGLNNIVISLLSGNISAYEKTYPKQDPQTFYQLIDNIKYFTREKKRRNINSKINLHFVICKTNYESIPDFCKLAVDADTDSVSFINLVVFDAIRSIALDDVTTGKVIDILESARKILGGKINHNIEGTLSAFVANAKDYRQFYSKNICLQPCQFARITVDGRVWPCCGAVWRRSMGNIFENSFDSIWNNKEYRRVRYYGRNIRKMVGSETFNELNCGNCPDINENIYFNSQLPVRLYKKVSG